MPSLHWIGKEKVMNHHMDVPFRVLEHAYGFTEQGEQTEPTNTGNKIIHGDNLEALKALLPEYAGKIKCIYIDPPYNTGNEEWVYNDNVNDPKIKAWLGKVVGKESEDLSRHDKWLCMMYPRLKLLHKLLADDGVILISIDDNEVAHLILLLNEIFGKNNSVGIFTWVRKKKGSFLSKQIRKMTEYVLCFEKNAHSIELYGEDAYLDKWQPIVKRTNSIKTLVLGPETITTTLLDGVYNKGFRGNPETGIDFKTDFIVEKGTILNEIEVEGHFVWSQDFLQNEITKGTKISLSNKFGFNVLRHDQASKIKTPATLLNPEMGIGTNEDASSNLQEIFATSLNDVFPYSKPVSLIQFLLNMRVKSSKDALILDSFAGSGTTAHAVLNLNKQDRGNRKFILIEMGDYANSITAERVKRVINGYAEVEGTGGAFDYYELGAPLFTEDGELNELLGVERLRDYIYFSETGLRAAHTPALLEHYYLGKHQDTAYYFFYEQDMVTALNQGFLQHIKERAEQYVIYADKCLLDPAFMSKHRIFFKKIPRDITRF